MAGFLRCVGGLVALVWIASFAGVARAQPLAVYFPTGVPGYDTMPGVTVLSRVRPDYEPPGIRWDGMVFHPEMQETAGYDSNVLGGTHPTGSWELGSHPSLSVGSDWASGDAAGAVLGLDDTRYFDVPRQSRTDGTVAAGGTLAIGQDRLTLAAAHLWLHEDRTALDALPSDTPIPYSVDDARLSYTWVMDGLALTPNAEFQHYSYDNTTILGRGSSQAYRDRDVLLGGLTARYELMPRLNGLAVVRFAGTNYTSPQIGQPSRNSTGMTVLVGLSDDGDAVWRYRLLLGWQQRQFSASTYREHDAPVAEGQLIYMPDGMDTLTATLTRSIEDAAQEGVAGYTYTGAKIAFDRECERDLLLQIIGGWQQADFLEGGGRQTAWLLGLGVTWLVNRQTRVSATYSFNDQQGGGPPGTVGPFNRSIGLLSMRYGW